MEFDEKTLKQIAEKTGGQYFLASKTEDLVAIYDTIDQLEKTKKESKRYFQAEEYFAVFLWPGLWLLLLESLLSLTRLRRIP
jgi:Ca-activated chloride channel family protein